MKSDSEVLRELADFLDAMHPIEIYAGEEDESPTVIAFPMLRVGPFKGDLEKTLRRIADDLENDMDIYIDRSERVFPPSYPVFPYDTWNKAAATNVQANKLLESGVGDRVRAVIVHDDGMLMKFPPQLLTDEDIKKRYDGAVSDVSATPPYDGAVVDAFINFVHKTGGQVIGVDLPGALAAAVKAARAKEPKT